MKKEPTKTMTARISMERWKRLEDLTCRWGVLTNFSDNQKLNVVVGFGLDYLERTLKRMEKK
jgi:hypothetical protein